MSERSRLFLWALVAFVLLAVLVGSALLPRLVADTLNPRLPALPYSPSPEAIALHETLTIADLHSDALLWDRDLTRRARFGHADFPRLAEGRVAVQAFTAVTKTPRAMNVERNSADSDRITALAVLQGWPPRTWTSLLERSLYQADKLRHFSNSAPGMVVMIESASDLDRVLRARAGGDPVIGVLLNIEGAHALQDRLSNVDVLFEAGFRMFGLTHFFDNEIGGSAHGVDKGGLTEFGRAAVDRMVALHVVIDLAHASPALIDDVLRRVTVPVVVSHTGVRATCDTSRNLDDAQLAAIARSGGVVGIGLWTEALCGETPADWARAVRHAVSVMGVDHVGLGSDWDGAVATIADASETGYLTDALLKEDFAPGEVRQIMGENVIRVLRGALPDR